MMDRVWLWVPLPQVLVQVDQVDHASTTQSTGHGCELQDDVSLVMGQAAPPNAGVVTTERARVVEPVPHVREQVDHGAHADSTQSTGQGCVLQDSEAAEKATAERTHEERKGMHE